MLSIEDDTIMQPRPGAARAYDPVIEEAWESHRRSSKAVHPLAAEHDWLARLP
jgi:hypothetical protein